MAKLLLVIHLVLATSALSAFPSPSPKLTEKCEKLITSLSSCLPYAANGSNATRPYKYCCKGVGFIVVKKPDCVCPIFNSIGAFNLNLTRALGLPKACSVKLPHDCKASPKHSHQPRPLPTPSPSPMPSPAPTPAPPKKNKKKKSHHKRHPHPHHTPKHKLPTPAPSPAPTPANAPSPVPGSVLDPLSSASASAVSVSLMATVLALAVVAFSFC